MGLGERVKILEEAAFHPPPQPRDQNRPTTAGRSYRLKIGRPRRVSPTFLSSVQNLHLTFASVRVIRGSISSSRRFSPTSIQNRCQDRSYSSFSSPAQEELRTDPAEV
jgi:hypothetical protein